MQQEIRTLVAVQETEQRIRALEAETMELPRRLAAADARRLSAEKARDAVRANLAKEEAARRRMEDDIRDHRQRITKLTAQTDSVTTTAQLQALEHELAFSRGEIVKIEDRELASMETTESLQAELARCEDSLATATREQEHDKQYVRTASARLREELATARTRRTELRSEADAALLANYDRIAKAKKTGFAEVIDAQCQGCHMQLRPQKWNQLRAGERLVCESCGRMLYYDEGSDKKLAAEQAGKLGVP